ncbi:2,3-dehydroadipyl-CoA hydratase [Pseudaminobacter arsenicus]|uniref:2,3-dehydroadipyl-CoA hydratase n=1 Tax=Borborobacter arsenicus TaxID=1851146 RepID=A0A432V381_9HYPH|nr:enoyl-CoA hydratase-related protein [Pseudaminobacter arsenicus]RUM96659.1 2,3-dehydroadipyl-CoA hydratase [Pseudaminobacter arsenicus]
MTRLIETNEPAPGVRLVRLNRASRLNALSGDLLVELAAELGICAASDDVRSVVLAGDERAFSAGADVHEMAAGGIDAIYGSRRLDAWKAIDAFEKPLIAAIEGIAFGGGHELVMLCDIVVAGAKARFAQPEVDLGSLPGDGGTQRLPRSLSKAQAMRLVLTGEAIDAATAERWGLVSDLVPAGEAVRHAVGIAARIAAKAPVAVKLAKQSVRTAYETTLSAGLVAERQQVRLSFQTTDHDEGVAAFMTKRKPNFQGR